MRVQHSITFPYGTLVRLEAAFTRRPTPEEIEDGTAKDAHDMLPIDPDTVIAKVMHPDGTTSAHAYEDSPADIVRDGVGEYRLDITADAAGQWTFRFEGSGNGQAGKEHIFHVEPSAFYP